MFAVIVHFEVNPDRFAEFMPLMEANARASLADEPGCQRFDVLTDPAQPNQVALYEIYDSGDAFQAHLKTPHFLEFDRTVAPMLVSKSVSQWSEVRV